MTLKKLGLLTAFCLTLVLYGCGGGGGGSNPVAVSTDPAVDATLSTEYPAISASYSAMQTALEGTAAPSVRVAAFMLPIANDFVDFNNVAAYSDLMATTTRRLTDYKINAYRFIPKSHTLSSDNTTLTISTYMYINLSKAATPESVFLDYSVTADLIWKKYGTDWKIQSGLPYETNNPKFTTF